MTTTQTKAKSAKKPAAALTVLLHARPTYRSRQLSRGSFGILEVGEAIYELWPLGASRDEGFRLIDADSGDAVEVLPDLGGHLRCECHDATRRPHRGKSDDCPHCQALLHLGKRGDL